jgi:hypothetical protein
LRKDYTLPMHPWWSLLYLSLLSNLHFRLFWVFLNLLALSCEYIFVGMTLLDGVLKNLWAWWCTPCSLRVKLCAIQYHLLPNSRCICCSTVVLSGGEMQSGIDWNTNSNKATFGHISKKYRSQKISKSSQHVWQVDLSPSRSFCPAFCTASDLEGTNNTFSIQTRTHTHIHLKARFRIACTANMQPKNFARPNKCLTHPFLRLSKQMIWMYGAHMCRFCGVGGGNGCLPPNVCSNLEGAVHLKSQHHCERACRKDRKASGPKHGVAHGTHHFGLCLTHNQQTISRDLLCFTFLHLRRCPGRLQCVLVRCSAKRLKRHWFVHASKNPWEPSASACILHDEICSYMFIYNVCLAGGTGNSKSDQVSPWFWDACVVLIDSLSSQMLGESQHMAAGSLV